MEPVIINFTWTAEDLLAARRWHQKQVLRPVFQWAAHLTLALIVAIIIAGSVVAYVKENLKWHPVYFILLAVVYLYLLKSHVVRWLTQREFAKRPDKNGEIQWTVSSERIQSVASVGNADLNWSAFFKVVRTPDGFLFYSTQQIFHFLPRRGFHNSEDFETVAKLAAELVPNYKVLK